MGTEEIMADKTSPVVVDLGGTRSIARSLAGAAFDLLNASRQVRHGGPQLSQLFFDARGLVGDAGYENPDRWRRSDPAVVLQHSESFLGGAKGYAVSIGKVAVAWQLVARLQHSAPDFLTDRLCHSLVDSSTRVLHLISLQL